MRRYDISLYKCLQFILGKYRAGDESKINPAPYRVADNFSQAVNFIEKLL